jgi:hypothetical protein
MMPTGREAVFPAVEELGPLSSSVEMRMADPC